MADPAETTIRFDAT